MVYIYKIIQGIDQDKIQIIYKDNPQYKQLNDNKTKFENTYDDK